MYLALGWAGFVVLDARYPEDSIVEVHRMDSVLCTGLTLRDTFLYASTTHLDVFNISDPSSPVLVARAEAVKNPPKQIVTDYLYISENLLFLSMADYWTIRIFDISDPDSLSRVADVPPYSRQVAFTPPHYLYTASWGAIFILECLRSF